MSRVGTEEGEVEEERVIGADVGRPADVGESRVINAEAGAHHQLGRRLIGKADARREVVQGRIGEAGDAAVSQFDAIHGQSGGEEGDSASLMRWLVIRYSADPDGPGMKLACAPYFSTTW